MFGQWLYIYHTLFCNAIKLCLHEIYTLMKTILSRWALTVSGGPTCVLTMFCLRLACKPVTLPHSIVVLQNFWVLPVEKSCDKWLRSLVLTEWLMTLEQPFYMWFANFGKVHNCSQGMTCHGCFGRIKCWASALVRHTTKRSNHSHYWQSYQWV